MKVFPNVSDFTFKNTPFVQLKDALSLIAKKYPFAKIYTPP